MSLATAIVYFLLVLLGLLVLVDIGLAWTGREMITTAVRNENAATGWLIAGGYVVLGFHLFVLPLLQTLWHRLVG